MTDEGEAPEESRRASSTDRRNPEAYLLSSDGVYESLSHPRRRYVCYLLGETDSWSLTDLATRIAAWESDAPPRTITDPHKERVYVSLYHLHVPKLVELNVVTFDEVSDRISAGACAADARALLRGVAVGVGDAESRGRDTDDEHG